VKFARLPAGPLQRLFRRRSSPLANVNLPAPAAPWRRRIDPISWERLVLEGSIELIRILGREEIDSFRTTPSEHLLDKTAANALTPPIPSNGDQREMSLNGTVTLYLSETNDVQAVNSNDRTSSWSRERPPRPIRVFDVRVPSLGAAQGDYSFKLAALQRLILDHALASVVSSSPNGLRLSCCAVAQSAQAAC